MPPAYRFVDRWLYRLRSSASTTRSATCSGTSAGGPSSSFARRATRVEAERPRRILSRLSKDFDGTGEWTLEETADGTVATLDWRPSVNHALIRYLTPVLRPLFRSNHNWAMRRGEQQIREYLRAT
jgi:hypothetical protein